jgi:hypothetical protein
MIYYELHLTSDWQPCLVRFVDVETPQVLSPGASGESIRRAFDSGGSRRHLLRSSTKPRVPLLECRFPVAV